VVVIAVTPVIHVAVTQIAVYAARKAVNAVTANAVRMDSLVKMAYVVRKLIHTPLTRTYKPKIS